MMKVIVVDISGKVDNYCTYLCEALSKEIGKNGQVVFFNTRKIDNIKCDFKKLVNLVPKKYQYSGNIWKRYLKALESSMNYLYIAFYVRFHKIDIVHLQWLPFLEFTSIESVFLKLIKGSQSHRKIVYTHHNLYPHEIGEENKINYRIRFDKVKKSIDAYIVHTYNVKDSFHKDFNIPLNMIYVACHGVFEPREAKYEPVNRNDGKLQFIMFGGQSEYKGTDLFIEAIKVIPEHIRNKMSFRIIGNTDKKLYDQYKSQADDLDVDWVPTHVSFEELHTSINQSDVSVFPYRAISQSGALLLAIYFEKKIIPSDLPSFKETLEDFKEDWFFSSEDIDSLSKLMIKHLDKDYFDSEIDVIKRLKKKYSWQSAARSTINVYNKFTM